MLKNKIDFKLINFAIIVLIIFLLYQTNSLWMFIINKTFQILCPFIIAFAVSYSLYPSIKYLQNKKIPKFISIFIILAIVIATFGFTIFTVFPLLFEQLISLFNGIITFIKEISMNYDIDFGPLQNTLSNNFNEIITSLSKYISNGAMNIVGVSLNYFTIFIIAFATAIYFLIDMDKIRDNIKEYLKSKTKRGYKYVSKLDHAMKNYLIGFTRIILINLFEYTILYLIIGHPNAILLGFLAAITTIVPYFGALFTNILSLITAFVVGPALFIKTFIIFIATSILDSYVINPLVYGKSNEIHPIIIILSVSTGGILFGIMGIIISLPLAIIIITTYNYFKNDISEKIDKVKGKKGKEMRK